MENKENEVITKETVQKGGTFFVILILVQTIYLIYCCSKQQWEHVIILLFSIALSITLIITNNKVNVLAEEVHELQEKQKK